MRDRCEVMFIARISHIVAVNGVRFDNKEEHKALIEVAEQAVLEPVIDLNKTMREFIRIKVQAMEKLTLKPACQKSFAEKILLTGYFFINDLVDRDYIDIPEGSNLQIVTDYLLTLIDPENPTTQKRMKSAKKQARMWLSALQNKGYFK